LSFGSCVSLLQKIRYRLSIVQPFDYCWHNGKPLMPSRVKLLFSDASRMFYIAMIIMRSEFQCYLGFCICSNCEHVVIKSLFALQGIRNFKKHKHITQICHLNDCYLVKQAIENGIDEIFTRCMRWEAGGVSNRKPDLNGWFDEWSPWGTSEEFLTKKSRHENRNEGIPHF